MKKKMVLFVKKNRVVYKVYNFFGSLLINVFKLFVPINNKRILFVSYGGRRFDDSPKVIYEAMIEDSRFNDYEFYWAFNEPEKFEIYQGKKIKIDSLKYFIIALSSRVWITNSSIVRGLNFKGKNTIYFNSWHGTPLKTLGSDINNRNQAFGTKSKSKFDLVTSQSNYEADKLSEAFNISRNKFHVVGLPRNDELVSYQENQVEDFKKSIGIPADKKVILYAPTFRDNRIDFVRGKESTSTLNLDVWKEELSTEFVLLIRAHYDVIKEMNFDNYKGFVYDVSDYDSLNELMFVSDILISDYSSIYFDYSILGRPMLHYTYDYEDYNRNRGLYFDIRNYIPGSSKDDMELVNIIKNLDFVKCKKLTIDFRKKYVEKYGDATRHALNLIYDSIKNFKSKN